MMNSNELHALADDLDEAMFKLLTYKRTGEAAKACERAADYLRAQADAQPVANLYYATSPHGGRRLAIADPMSPQMGQFAVYTHPAPAAPQAEPCIGNDPACPCQDGDACHYKDGADGTKAWSVPQAEPKREPLSDKMVIACARVAIARIQPDEWVATDADLIDFARAIESEHGIGGSDE